MPNSLDDYDCEPFEHSEFSKMKTKRDLTLDDMKNIVYQAHIVYEAYGLPEIETH